MSAFAGWPAPAVALVERSLARYGGDAGRARLERLRLAVLSTRGSLPWWKGLGRTFVMPPRVEIEAQSERVWCRDFPSPGQVGLYEAGNVGIADSPAELVPTDQRADLLAHKTRRWRDRDALYFFGYALAHYHALPWTLPDASFVRLRDRALTVRFPEPLHTHSRLQTFHFDATGLIVRHDYVADVVGPWAAGAHFWCDYVLVEDVPVAERRVVRARLGRVVMPWTILDVRLRVQ